MTVALTRAVPPSITDCEITHIERTQIDFERAAFQHADYERTLVAFGCRVERVAAAPDLPDSVFVEDTAVVLDEVAVITRPGAPSRRPETTSIKAALGRYRSIEELASPATMDGGDVLRIDRRLYVGLSSRTNEDGVRQLAAIAEPYGYTVHRVAVRRCLHLKSAVTWLGGDRLLHDPAWVDAASFDGVGAIAIDPLEPGAANVLQVGAGVVVAAQYPRTREILVRAGYDIGSIDVSELSKAEAGVTCCSLIVS